MIGSRVLLLAPAPALAPFVHAFALRRPCAQAAPLPALQRFPAQWRGALSLVSEGTLLDGHSGAAVGRAEFCGPRLRPGLRRYRGEPVVTTVLFQPGVLGAWLGPLRAPALEARVPAEALLGAAETQALLRLIHPGDSPAQQVWRLEQWLLERLQGLSVAPLWPQTVRDWAGFDVMSWAAQLGCSARQLQRRVQALQGLSPKPLLRVLRMQHCLRLLHQPGQPAQGALAQLEQIAQASGYCDGAHMARELRALTGSSPQSLRELLQRSDPRPWIQEPLLQPGLSTPGARAAA
ncbi:AraC family transcriptional regulator [Inhella proteolytica]|uniref:AraC family transcriptional regulator n=1 Tax=Inhella proteolytica TaxID=2795029 RepID=A0A931J0E9_9BURK|nr:helix-turn-helix domain-containing protein [Inhella proteolytica]MBH9577176.1 AraC family transcriptional regulator [Inhella proteolytica]